MQCSCRAVGGARFAGSIPPLSPLSIAELGIAQLRLDRLRKKVSVDHPWVHAAVTDWDAQTVDTFARRYLRTRDARMFLNLATELVFGAEIEELSLLYFLFYLQSGGGLTSLTEFEGGAQQDHFVGGSQQLCDRLADGSGMPCGCGTPVAAVEQDGDEVRAAHRGRRCDARSPRDRGRVARALRTLALDAAAACRSGPACTAHADGRLHEGRCSPTSGPGGATANLSGIAYADAGPVQMVVDSGSEGTGGGCSPASSPGARSSATAGSSWARARPRCASHSPACSARPPLTGRHMRSATGRPSPTAAAGPSG